MGIFNIFKFFKDNKRVDKILKADTQSELLRQRGVLRDHEKEINDLRIETDEKLLAINSDMTALKEGVMDNNSLRRINDKFTEILKNFVVVKEISETLVPAVSNHTETIDVLIAQNEALSTILILLTDALISAKVITEDDIKPADYN